MLLCLTKQQFTLKIAQNHEAGFRFCQEAHVRFRFLAKEFGGLLAPLTLNLRDHIQPTESVRRRPSLSCTEQGLRSYSLFRGVQMALRFNHRGSRVCWFSSR